MCRQIGGCPGCRQSLERNTPMHSTRRFLSVGVLSLGLALSPTLVSSPSFADTPLAPAHTATEQAVEKTILKTEHTDAVALALKGSTLEMFTYADLPDANRTRLDPAATIFNLEDTDQTHLAVPPGFDFIAPVGTPMWLAPQTQAHGVLWPGWNTEDVRPGALKDDTVYMELVDAKTPEGGAVEVFQVPAFGDPIRVFSSDEELGAYAQPVAAHVHANWGFTRLGTYELTFRASAQLPDGTPVSAEQVYTFVVGEIPADEPSPAPTVEPTSVPTPAPTDAPVPVPSVEPTVAPSDEPTAAPTAESSADPTAAPTAEPSAEPTATPGDGASVSPSAAPSSAEPSSAAPSSAPEPSAGAAVAPKAPAQAPGASQGQPGSASRGSSQGSVQQAPARAGGGAEQCLATEQLVKAAEGGKTTADRAAFNKADYSIRRAVHPGANRAVEGHFDFGAVLTNGVLSAQIKDDRTSPAVWKQTGALNFVLGDSARVKMPAGMGHVAPAGSEVYLIGATQQAGVPWLGWNTQNSELVNQAAGEATMTLKSLEGPGKMSVFLSGNFGATGTTVFNGVGDSFNVPMNTHQHGNWVFTAPGNYSATIEWSVKLKDGSAKTAQGTLGFIVGDAPAAEQGSAPKDENRTKDSESAGEQTKDTGVTQQEPRGSVNAETGIVTKADGSQVRIVGKTADGRDCELPAAALKEAQKASAEGRLAHTGAQAGTAVMVGASALALGVLALLVARRRRAA